MSERFELTEAAARKLDEADPLRHLRQELLFPKDTRGEPVAYFAGNSLGLQPRKAKVYIDESMEDWARLGVDGHLQARSPWLPYHELVTAPLAAIVGAKPSEVVAMNSLTVNLHLMLVSFYQPTRDRFRILIEAGAFSSDRYAVGSQARFHGHDQDGAIIEVAPRPGEACLRQEDLIAQIEQQGASLALVLLGNVNYFTGQAFDMRAITEAAHAQGARAGFDLAHGVGNLPLALHDSGADFAVWCSYKYLNGGPGAIAGAFVHERHGAGERGRFAGWWGHDKANRFKMGPEFQPLSGAEGWQLSNPPIFQLAALRASLELFEEAGMPRLREKSVKLTAFLEQLVDRLPAGICEILTPREPDGRGAQLSLRFRGEGEAKRILEALGREGVVCDLREPDVLRVAPAPMYCTFQDVFRFSESLRTHAAR